MWSNALSRQALLASFCLLTVFEMPVFGMPATPSTGPDCGWASLYSLLRLEGHSVTVSDIKRNLPPPDDDGYSMLELLEAASRCGLNLNGVRLVGNDQVIDRPMILFFDQKPHGHFLVARPVGHSGKLVQVLELGSPPDVLDQAQLLGSEQWTGLALVPASSKFFGLFLGVGGVVLVGALTVWTGLKRQVGRRFRWFGPRFHQFTHKVPRR